MSTPLPDAHQVNFDHLNCIRHYFTGFAKSELTGCIDIGPDASRPYYLAHFHLELRPGREAQDLDAAVAYLTSIRAKVAQAFATTPSKGPVRKSPPKPAVATTGPKRKM